MRVLGIGEVLWDVFPTQELLGGAALNFCVNLQRLGDSATLLSAVGKDARGALVLDAMHRLSLESSFVQTIEGMPTGFAAVEVNTDGEPHFTIRRPLAFDRITLTPEILARLAACKPDWLYFGTLLQTEPGIEQITRDLVEHLPGIRRFYDMNLREGHWNFELVKRLCGLASVLKLNESEAQIMSELSGTLQSQFSLEVFCREWASQFGINVICVTLGSRGCFIYQDGYMQQVPGNVITVCDTVGSGDAFAAAFLHGYHRRWPIVELARFANALGALVASRAGATPTWGLKECMSLAVLDLQCQIEK